MDVPSLTKLVEAIRATGFDQRLMLFGSSSALASFPDLGTSEDSMVRHSRDADFVLDPWDDEVALQIHEVQELESPSIWSMGFTRIL